MQPHPNKVRPDGCITFIGMAAAGKTTVGRELAMLLGWAHLDTDHVIEAAYGAKLQSLTDKLDREAFLDVEAHIVRNLTVKRAVLSTGGSIIYRQTAVDHLAALGPIIHLETPMPVILARIARKPNRGLVIAPGQTIEDLYAERHALYQQAATITFTGGNAPATLLAEEIAQWLCAS